MKTTDNMSMFYIGVYFLCSTLFGIYITYFTYIIFGVLGCFVMFFACSMFVTMTTLSFLANDHI